MSLRKVEELVAARHKHEAVAALSEAIAGESSRYVVRSCFRCAIPWFQIRRLMAAYEEYLGPLYGRRFG